jgi:hypothetical protein
MKPIHLVVLGFALAFASRATAGPAGNPAPGAPPAVGEPAKPADAANIKCIRERVTGSNKIVKLCLPAERLKRLTPEERMDMVRSPRGAAVLDD